ncbi:uncharacterized protein EAE98_008817 [Botrytis deweyae]|uniref:Uncharacterized protein n=1 Tax=Botrytis deweyae TaxID=2478750 RepID=A0ABQ7IE04_9HELO|nr:uncharacterized protein EAE98_008817 [Botrytis deweyae]KAF7920788.1 hypothetical protein EAE98_008817 [Botrytis deweyae]
MKQLSITNFFGNNEISISPQDASRTTTTISKQFEPSPTSEIIEPSTPHGFNYSKSPTPLEESVESATISLESENTISPESNTERPGNISVLDFDQRDGNEIELFLACSRQVFNERFNILGDDLDEINYDSEEDMDDYGEDLDDFSLFEERVVNVLKATTRCYMSDQWHEFIEMRTSTQ